MSFGLQGITSIASVLIALLALFRPEWSKLFRRWTSQLHLSTLPRVEVGYGGFGASIGVGGSIRALNHDQFVELIDLLVIREADQSRHQFQWAVFRGAQIVASKPEDLQMALGFSLGASDAKLINVQFHEAATRLRMEQRLGALRSDFFKYLTEHNILLREVASSDRLKLYKDFSDAQPALALNVWDELNRTCFWEAGNYRMVITVSTTHPTKNTPSPITLP